jgi:hypothetical protein
MEFCSPEIVKQELADILTEYKVFHQGTFDQHKGQDWSLGLGILVM